MDENEKINKVLIFRPISLFYLVFLFFLSIFMLPYLIVTGIIFSHAIGVPSYLVFIIFLLSLLGSHVNIRIKEVESIQPMIYYREVNFFGVRWQVPETKYGAGKTTIAINLGGALIPVLFSLYLLIFSIPANEENSVVTYVKIFVAFIIVTLVVHAFAKPLRGLGIAVPSFIPPLTSAIIAAILFPIYVKTNPFIIAYIAGTLGIVLIYDSLL